MSERSRARVCGAGLAALGIAVTAPAAGMEVSGAIEVGAIYSDNITLAPDGFEEDDFVLRAAPTIVLASVGRRYDFGLDYTLEALWYQDQPDSDEVYSQGNTHLDLELLEEQFFLNSLASISQAVIDPEQPFSAGNVPAISNRTDAVRYQTGPEWRQDILGSFLNVRYDIGRVDYDDRTLQDSDYQLLDTDWTGPEKERGLTWAIRHEYRNFDYDVSESVSRQLAELSLIYELGDGWAPFASAGMESDVEDRSDASLEDGIWRAGLRRNTARSFFEAFVGERSFGTSWGTTFQRQYGADSSDILRFSYRETPRTNEELYSTLVVPTNPPGTAPPTDPVVPPPVVPPDVNAPGTGDFSLTKRGDVLISRGFNRNTVSVNLFHEDNESLDDSTPADSDNTRQTGLALAWAYDFAVRTRASLDGYYADREFSRVSSPDDEDSIFRVRLGLAYLLGARTSVTGWIGREERSGSDTETNNYAENQVGVSVGRTF